MKKRVFLICPASQVEPFIRKKYGDNAFFLTALGCVFSWQEEEYVEAFIQFIEKEAIEEVVVVQDVSCFFLHHLLSKKSGFGTRAEQVLLDLLLDHYDYVMEPAPVAEQKQRLAELNVERQIEGLLALDFFWQQTVLQKLKVTGLVTSAAEGKVRPAGVTSGVSQS